MTKLNILLVLTLEFVAGIHSIEYYWREYDGSIPNDAIVAGEDSRGPIYIGQGLCSYGIYPGTIIKGELNLSVPCRGDHPVNATYLKILCSTYPNNFYFLPTNNTSYLKDINGKSVVIAGFSSSDVLEDAYSHVGRAAFNDLVNIGFVDRYAVLPQIYIAYPGKNTINQIRTGFEVLVYGVRP